MTEESTRVFADGSGKGYCFVVFGKTMETADDYFKKLEDPEHHEYQSILYALSLMDPSKTYELFNDNAGVIDHITGACKPPHRKQPKIMKLLQAIWRIMEQRQLQVNFHWIRRGRNPAGHALDRYIHELEE